MSCGRPKCRAAARASAATLAAPPRRSALAAGKRGWTSPSARRPVVAIGTCIRCFGTMRRSTIVPARSTSQVSASASPDTSAEPSPCTALTTATPRRPETGSALNATPAARGATMRCTITAGARRRRQAVLAAVGENPSAEAGRQTARTRSGTSAGGTFRKLSSCPANECCGAVLVAGRRSDGHELAVGRRVAARPRITAASMRSRERHGLEHASERGRRRMAVRARSAAPASGSRRTRRRTTRTIRHRAARRVAARASAGPCRRRAATRRPPPAPRIQHHRSTATVVMRQRRGAEAEVHQQASRRRTSARSTLPLPGVAPRERHDGDGDTARTTSAAQQHQHRRRRCRCARLPATRRRPSAAPPGATRATAPCVPQSAL